MVKLLRGLACLLLVAACGESEPVTQLALVADSDLVLDRIEFEISAPGRQLSAQATRQAGGGPSFVSLMRDEGALGPITVSARGIRAEQELLRRTHVVSFVPDQTRVVALDLYARCQGMACPPDQTCGAAGCTQQALAEASLPRWSGAPESPFVDGGVAEDAGWLRQCGGPMPVDVSMDPMNCGACASKCEKKQTCKLGVCAEK